MNFITGATGLLGSQLTYDLISAGHPVKALKRKSSDLSPLKKLFSRYAKDKAEMLISKIEWCDGDISDSNALLEMMKGVRHVYHCAAVVSFNRGDRELLMKINVEGTANVVNMALEAGVEKICHVSSTSALGRSDDESIINEKTEWNREHANSSYALSKHLAEREAWRGMAEGLETIVVNPSIILGPGNWKDSSSKIFMRVWNGLKFYSVGVNAFVDVRDVSRAMIMLMQGAQKNEKFIVSSENLTYKEVFDEISDGFSKPKPFLKVTPFLAEIIWRIELMKNMLTGIEPVVTRETARTATRKYFYSNEKIRKALNFEFIPVKKSLRDNCRIFLEEEAGK